MPSQDLNNLIYVPLNAAIMRLDDSKSQLKDEIDGMYLQMSSSAETLPASEVVRSLLNVAHPDAGDFTVIAPAELLDQQQRTQHIFDLAMGAIASLSLLLAALAPINIILPHIP